MQKCICKIEEQILPIKDICYVIAFSTIFMWNLHNFQMYTASEGNFKHNFAHANSVELFEVNLTVIDRISGEDTFMVDGNSILNPEKLWCVWHFRMIKTMSVVNKWLHKPITVSCAFFKKKGKKKSLQTRLYLDYVILQHLMLFCCRYIIVQSRGISILNY